MQKLARAPNVACAAVALAALAVSPAALAQSASRRTRQQDPPEKAAKVPAAAPAPPPPAAPVEPAPILEPRASDGTRIVALIGVEAPLGDDEAEMRLKAQLELSTELRRIGPRACLEGVLSVGFIPYSKSETVAGTDMKFQSNTFELVPAFRFSFGLGEKVTLQADTGIGATYLGTKSTVGPDTITDASWGEVLRFAAGLSYDVNDHLRLGGRAGIDFIFYETLSKAAPLFFEASWRM
jgi:hypothetical protein